jgi:hypothetical protein
MPMPVRLVYSSVPADEAFREQLSTHLHTLVQNGLVSEWYEQQIPAGSDVVTERHHAWQSADILLLLLSADYFASDAFDSHEMQQALDRHRSGQLRIVPLLLRPCDWQSTLVAGLQCLPRNGKPLSKWDDRDDAFLTIVQDLRHIITGQEPATSPVASLTSEQRTNRQRLLKRVRSIWIEGLLEQSLQHATWVDLHLQKQPDAVDNPWRLVVQELDREPRPLPPGTSILQVFDEADEELLILGNPGAGKTTLLLYLARTLLDRAERDERRRLPVIFNLSSWAKQRLPLTQWLLEELTSRYQVPRKVGQAWLETNQIFPLLDGLDEVGEPAREACVQAITSFTQQLPERMPLIICCRTEEYKALSLQLPLQYAVMLLPFSDEQIEVYLSSVSGRLDALREAFREDKDLFELARQPLMLSVFTQAYYGEDSLDLLTATTREEYPRALFRQYVKHMLKRRAQLQQGTEEQTRRWLTYFATQLHQQQQTLFAVEELQPSWLPERYRSWYRWSMALAYGLTFGLLGGPLFCLTFGVVYELMYRTPKDLIFGSVFGLLLGLVGGLTGGVIFGLVFRHHQTIQPAEITVWSWSAAGKGLFVGALGGLAFGLVGGLVGWVIARPIGGVVVGCVVVCVIASVGGLVGGLSPTQMPERISLSPNEGIWRSGRRGLIAVLVFVLLVGLAAGLVVGQLGRSIHNEVYGLIFGLIFGSVGGLVLGLAFNLMSGRTGIAAFLQHFVLRFFLWRLGLLPWDLVAFLDEATTRLLLRKVGGSYIFVHRLLRDVLATQGPQE